MNRLLFFLLLTFFTITSFAQNNTDLNLGSIEQKEYMQKIPYRKISGKMIVGVSINGKPYNFLFDTGSPFSISDKLFRELNLSAISKIEVNDQSGLKDSLSIIMAPRLDIGQMSFINTVGLVMPEAAAKVFECFGIDGIIGSNMLRNSIVQVDDKKSQIVITNDLKNLNLKKVPYQEMKLSFGQSNPYIKVALQKGKETGSDEVLFDSGSDEFYQMSVTIYNWFHERVDMVDEIAAGRGGFSWGFYGSAKDQQQFALNIPEFRLNGIKFNNVFTLTTHSGSAIGSKVLEYGKTTLDYKAKRFYYEPYEDIKTEELSKREWPVMEIPEENKMVIGMIWERSLENEINLGDEVLKFGDIDYSSKSICDLLLSEMKLTGDKAMIELKDVKTGKIKKVLIKRL